VEQLTEAGFDLVHAFDTAVAAREPGLERLAGAERRGLLIGNTRALWPRFVAAMRDPALAGEGNPLERYTEQAIATAFPDARVYYGHRRYDGAFIPMQRLAVATGLGALAPNQLVIHPIYGPWFALRAAVVLDLAGPAGDAPVSPPVCADCTHTCELLFQRASAAQVGEPDISSTWPLWLAVRDACPVGRDWRYGDDQIRYHYAKDRSVLERASR